jgi:hypothetical protein
MKKGLQDVVAALSFACVVLAFSPASVPLFAEDEAKTALPPEPVVNHMPSDARPGRGSSTAS